MNAEVDHFHEHGYVVLECFLSAEDLAPAQAELPMLFPTPEEFHSDADPERNARFRNVSPFAGIDPFPYDAVEWSLLTVHPKLVAFAEAVLESDDIRLYEAHNWAKYGAATDYNQGLHRDYRNHTPMVPTDDRRFGEVEMFVYIHDVGPGDGPTRVVSRTHT